MLADAYLETGVPLLKQGQEGMAGLMQMIMDTYSKRVQFKQVKDVMKLEMKNEFRSTEETFNYLINFIKEIHSKIFA